MYLKLVLISNVLKSTYFNTVMKLKTVLVLVMICYFKKKNDAIIFFGILASLPDIVRTKPVDIGKE